MFWVRTAGVLFVLWVGVVAGIATESGIPPALIFSSLVAVGVWRLLQTRRTRSRLYTGEIDESCLICGSASLEQLEAEYEYHCRECDYDSEAARGPQTAHLARWIDTVAGASRSLGDADQGKLASGVATHKPAEEAARLTPAARATHDKLKNELMQRLKEETVA